jgi:hypothetical protein
MSCVSETYSSTIDPRPPLYVPDRSGGARPRSRVTQTAEERREMSSRPGDRSHAVPDTTKADPEHIWGDEGLVNA